MSENIYKVFVGNVHFQCTRLEFHECFKNLRGFLKAEIICESNVTSSRGFGFVTFEKLEDTRQLLDCNEMKLKGRILRFTEYMNNEHNDRYDICDDKYKIVNDIFNRNLLMVLNIPNDMTREKLHGIFSLFSDVGRHFICRNQDTGEKEKHAIVEILDDDIYNLLSQQKKININEETFDINVWNIQMTNKNNTYKYIHK
jgi:RNA recognition motif-containing protein